MKLPQFFLLLLLSSSSVLNAQSTPEASAAMEVRSTTQGFLPPRMTTAQRDAISSPAEGLLIYNTTTQKINFYTGSTNGWNQAKEKVPVPIAAVANFTFESTANFLENSPVHGDYQVVITNSSLSAIAVTFTTSDVTFSGVSGVSVTAVSDASETIAPGASHTVSYTLSGTAGNAGILTGAYVFGSLSANANITVDANPLISHNGKDYYTVLSSTGKTWLDRNLGADQVATSSTDAASYGDLYQWGRNADGHEARTSSTAAGPVASGSEGSNFITVSSGDWLSTSDNTRWNGTTKGTHDPCPSGFRVPTETELNNERLQFPSNNAAGAFASALKLPVAGYRIRLFIASLHEVGSYGFYWSSTTHSLVSSSYYLFFFTNNTYMTTDHTRANGYSVRCIEQ